MKILLSSLSNTAFSFSVFYDHLFRWLISNFPAEKTEVIFVLTKKIYDESKDYQLPGFCHKVLMSDTDFLNIFCSKSVDESLYLKLLENNFSEESSSKLKNFMNTNCKDFIPDIIITQGIFLARQLWRKIYPNALCLTNENAVFSRPPFIRTLCYEPFEPVPNTFIVRYSDNIKIFSITKQQNKEIEKFKHKLTKLIDKNDFIKKDIAKYKQRFKKLVLLPLVSDHISILLKDSLYPSEFEMIEDVLEHTPKDVGICVTQHDIFRSLTDEDIEYFSSKYPNFIFLQKTNESGYASNSLHYFKHVDVVFNTTSKTALTGLLWDKPVLSLAKLSNIYLEDGNGIKDIEKVLRLKKQKKNNILYWYFTRYCLFEPDMVTPCFMYDYFAEKIEYYNKHGIDFGYFNEVNDFKRVTKQVIDGVKEYYRTPFERNLIAKINMFKENLNKKIREIIVLCKILINQ